MSCWVVPTVAAEYWGVTLDVVWRRIYEGLVPHKNDRGFVFVDVDPWTPDAAGVLHHEPPPTFVTPREPLLHAPAELAPCWEGTGAPIEQERDPIGALRLRPVPARAGRGEDSGDREEGDEDELPPLDEEESATFGRLSWHEVRQRVSRTRRPPPAFRN
jgi:hypothetical protein